MMKSSLTQRRWVTVVLLSTISAALLAPAAHADHGSRRWKGGPSVRRAYAPGSTYVVRRSSAGPVIAGFVGGLFLGAALANAAPAGYDYYDPYCQRSYSSLQIYYSHLRTCRHPREVRVIAVSDRGYGGYGDEGGWYRGERAWERERGYDPYDDGYSSGYDRCSEPRHRHGHGDWNDGNHEDDE